MRQLFQIKSMVLYLDKKLKQNYLSKALVHIYMIVLSYTSTVVIWTYSLQYMMYKCNPLQYMYSMLINGTVHKSVWTV